MKLLKTFTFILFGLLILIGCNTDSPATESAAVSHDEILAQIPSLRSESPRQAPGTFVGQVAGSTFFIGLVIQEGQAVAYLCNGEDIGEWLKGSVSDGQVTLSNPNGTNLTASLDGRNVRGTVALLGGQSFSFEAVPAKANTGFFRLVETEGDSRTVSGWILTEAGLRGTTSNGGHQIGNISLPPAGKPSGGSSSGNNQASGGSSCFDQFTGGCSMPCDGLSQWYEDTFNALNALEAQLVASGVTNVGDDPVYRMLDDIAVDIFAQMENNGCFD
jgi:hypothetical protein